MSNWTRQEPTIVAAIRKLQEFSLRLARLEQLKNAQRTLATLRALTPPPKEK